MACEFTGALWGFGHEFKEKMELTFEKRKEENFDRNSDSCFNN
jgi:hypothetical protein